MSLLGNLARELTKTAGHVGEALVNGAANITEVVTDKNELTRAVRDTGLGIVKGAKDISDAMVDMGEQLFGVEDRPKE